MRFNHFPAAPPSGVVVPKNHKKDFGRMFIFYHVAKQASFSAAATHLGLSRTMITQAVVNLEKAFSVRLFHRTTRSFSLTQQGNQLFVHAQRMYSVFENACSELRSEASEPIGKISVQIPGVLLDVPGVHAILVKFMEAHPQVTFDISNLDRVGDLVERHIDLALQVGPLQDSSYYARLVHTFDTYILGSPDYLARHGWPAHPSELETHRVFNYRHCSSGDKWMLQDPETKVHQAFPFGRSMTVDSERLLVSFAEKGQGISSALDIACAHAINEGRLVPLLKDWTYQIPLYLVYVQKKFVPKSLRMLIDVLVEELPHALKVNIKMPRSGPQ